MAPKLDDPAAEKDRSSSQTNGHSYLDDIPPREREGFPASGFWSPTTAALFWCDGKPNLAEVIQLTELELGP